jgi:hypothetical protein
VLRGFATEAEASLAASVLEANGVRAEVRTQFGRGYAYRSAVLVQADHAAVARVLLDTPAAPMRLEGAQHAQPSHMAPRTRTVTRLAGDVILCVAAVVFIYVLSVLLGLTPKLASSRVLSIVGLLLLLAGNALRQNALAPER